MLPLLQRGFKLNSSKYLSVLSLDEIKELLVYDVIIDQVTLNRIFDEKREDILQIIEGNPEKHCSIGHLFSAYVAAKDFSRFKHGVTCHWYEKLDDSYYYIEQLFENCYLISEEWTDFLLANGFDINRKYGQLLHKACRELNVDLAIYLLEHGADPYLKEKYDSSIFELVSSYSCNSSEEEKRQKEILCKYLLDMGIDPIMQSYKKSNYSGSVLSNLMNLSNDFKLYLVDWLASHGRINDYEYQNDKALSEHSLFYIFLNKHSRNNYDSKIFRKLIECGAETDVSYKSSDKLFLDACRICTLEDLKFFVKSGANINETYSNSQVNGLQEAISSNQEIEVIAYLLELGLKVQESLFLLACRKCTSVEQLDLIIKAGANINEIDKCAKTNGLFEAVGTGRDIGIIKYLIDLGLDVNNMRPERKGFSLYTLNNYCSPAKSVLDIAEMNDNKEVIHLLKNHGAKHASELLM